MKKYPKYKDSGLKLVNNLPEHWEKTRLKYIGFLYGGLTGKSGEDFKRENDHNNKPFINFTNICNNTYISKDNFGVVSILKGENQNQVKQGDLFFLMSSETHEDIGKTSVLRDDIGEVYLNSFCKGFRITKENIDSCFLNYLLNGNNYRQLMSVNGKGFTRINLRQDKVNDFLIYYPTLVEQLQIVEFLDQKTSIIDDLIQKKQRKIELLKEQKTSIINQTVTKGLNPDVKMKDSGVEWIGAIPEHWMKKKIKFIGKVYSGDSVPSELILEDGNYPVYGGNGILGYYSDFNFDRPVLSIGRVGEKCGNVHLIDKPVWINDNSLILDLFDGESDLRYLFFTMMIRDLNTLRNQNTQPLITGSSVKNEFIPFPPLPEQNQIVEYLNQKTTGIDTTITLENQKIDLLKEYRQSLISEVVTGKIDVRKN